MRRGEDVRCRNRGELWSVQEYSRQPSPSPGRRVSMRTGHSTSGVAVVVTSHKHVARPSPTVMSDTDVLSVTELIALVKERPVLWDRQEEVYKNRKLTRQAWAEICEALIDNYHDLGEHEKQAIGRSIIGKWANLRDNWLRYWRKRQDLLRVGSSTKSLKKYIHHDQLLFLSKVYDPEGQQEVEEIQVEVDVISDPEFETTLEFDETSQTSWSTQQYAQFSAPQLPQDQAERHLYFFHSIMPMISDFNDDQMLEFHSGVLECVKRVKNRELITSQNLHNFYKVSQESNLGPGNILKSTNDASAQNDCSCNVFGQIQFKKEPSNDCSPTFNNCMIAESTSTSDLPDGTSYSNLTKQNQTISCNKSEFVSLKDAILKLEDISETLESQFVMRKQNYLGKSFNSLLEKLSPKNIQSLKRKMVKKVARGKLKRKKIDASDYIINEISGSPQTLDVAEEKVCTGKNQGVSVKEDTSSILRDTLNNLTPVNEKL